MPNHFEYRLLVVLTFLLAVFYQSAAAQSPASANQSWQWGDWPAAWITHPEAPRGEYGVYHFRRTFDLSEKPDTFVVHVSADNRYRLFVNGIPVSSGPARGDLENWYYETVDIAPHLQAGQNVIAAVVWNFAQYRPVAQITHQTGFVLQGDSETEQVVNTGKEWKVLRDEAYEPIPVRGSDLGNVYIVVGPGDRVDASRYPWGWETAGYNDQAWVPAGIIRNAVPKWGHHHDIYVGWKLVPRDIPQMEENPIRIPRVRLVEGVETDSTFLAGTRTLTIPANTRARLLLDQAELVTAYPELTVSGGQNANITLTYAEALFDEKGSKGNRNEIEGKRMVGYKDVFLPDGGGGRLFRPLWFRTYRYLQLEIETKADSLVVDNLVSMFSAYPFQEKGSFTSSDTSLDDIWKVGWRTARLCAGETYFDCPYYEQLQYAGDTRIQSLISLYVAGDDRLMRKALKAYHQSREPDGLTQSRYPAWEQQFIPPFSLFWVDMIHDYWMHRDDPAFVKSFLTGIRGVLDWYEGYVDETGMLGPMPAWNFVDWSFPGGTPPGAVDGHSAIISLQYVYALQYASEMAQAFNRPDEARHYRELAEKVKKATYERCWDSDRNYLADTPDKKSYSQHVNLLAVLVDAIPAAQQTDFTRRLLDDHSLVQCTYYYRFYLTRAMKKAGLAELYTQRLDPWKQMLALGLTTFAEEPDPTRSDCHAWSSSPNYDFLATVCGIEPASPGFKTVRIAPALGSLSWAEGRLPHPAGELLVNLRRTEGDGIQADVTLPPGVTGTFAWKGKTVPLKSGVQRVTL